MQQNVIEFMSCEYVPTSATLGKKKGGWRQDVVPRSVVPGVLPYCIFSRQSSLHMLVQL